MYRTRTHLVAASLTLALVNLPTMAYADRVIDSFADPLPDQTLPGSTTPLPMLWAGKYLNYKYRRSSNAASQSGLAGVLGGERYTRITAPDLTNFITLVSSDDGDRHIMDYASGVGGSGATLLQYGATTDINADLLADGSMAFEIEIVGDMDDGIPRPIQLIVEVVSGSGQGLAQAQITVLADGVYQVPFSSFPGVDFTDVDAMKFTIDASMQSAVDYNLVGGIRTTSCIPTSGPARADIFLDTFESALPDRVLPGYGSYPIMWVGTFNGVQKAIDAAAQSGVFGAIGGQRDTTLEASSITNFITASVGIVDATPEFSYATGYPTSGSLTLEYGAQGDLDADLGQMVAFELELDGDLSSGPRPVPLTVTVASGAGSASTQVVLIANGVYHVPFSSLPGVDFSDVDYVSFHFDATQVQAVDYTLIGGLRASACMP